MRRRRRRRNAWRGDRAGHRRAALKGWRRKGRGRRKCRNPFAANPRRRRRGRRRWHNPSLVASAKSAYSGRNLKAAASVFGGLFAGGAVSRLATRFLGSRVPAITSTWGQAALNFGSALVVGLGAKAVAPRHADMLATGALAGAVGNVANIALSGTGLMQGLRDYLVQNQVNNARSISGMRDYLLQQQVNNARSISGMSGLACDYEEDGEFW